MDGSEVLGGASVCREETSSPELCTSEEGVILHSCCTGVLGYCSLTTESNCSFQDGYYHPNTVSIRIISTHTHCLSLSLSFSLSAVR